MAGAIAKAAAGCRGLTGTRKRRGAHRLHGYVLLLTAGIRPEEARAPRARPRKDRDFSGEALGKAMLYESYELVANADWRE